MIESLKFSTLKQHARSTIKRFPFLALLSLCTFILVLMESKKAVLLPLGFTTGFFEDSLLMIYFVGLYAIPLAIIGETLSVPRMRPFIASLVLGVATWFAHEWGYTPYQFEVALGFATFLLCSVAPFIKDGNNDRLCHYWYTITQSALWTFMPCLLMVIAVMTLQFSLDKLFGVKIERFGDTFIYGGIWILIAPLLFFGQLPPPDQLGAVKECIAPKPIKIMLTWLLIPFSFAFFFVLYAYFIKAAITQENVRGVLVGLIIGYSLFGISVLLSSYPLIIEENKFAKILHQYFFAIILLPAAILLWRVWVRIDVYGLTVDRIFAALFAIWLLAIALYYLSKKITERQLRFIPLSLGIITLLMYAGPWDPQSLAINSQKQRLIAALSAENLYANNRIVIKEPKPKITSLVNQEQIVSSFDYLNRNNSHYHWRRANRRKENPLAVFFKETPLEKDFHAYKGIYSNATYGYRLLGRFAVPLPDAKADTGSYLSRNRAVINLDFYNSRTYSNVSAHVVSGYDVFIDNVHVSNSSQQGLYFTIEQSYQSSDKSDDIYSVQPALENAQQTVLVLNIMDPTKKVIDILRVDLGARLADFASGKQTILDGMKGLVFETSGKRFKVKLVLKNWQGRVDYPDESAKESQERLFTQSLNASIILKKL